MTQDANGDLLTSTKQANIGDDIRVVLSDGILTATVTDKKENVYGKQ